MLLHPPVLQAPVPKPLPKAQAEDQVLTAYDDGAAIPEPKVLPREATALAWLRANAGDGTPRNPFRPGTEAHREAKALLALRTAPEAEWKARLAALPLRLTGTQLGLWRWGQALSRQGRLDPAMRHQFEDRLAESPVAFIRGYALRHALCFAVAERDEARFARLRGRYEILEEDLFGGYQRLFALLDGPAPSVRLYRLPGLDYEDVSLARLGRARLWMTPAGPDLERLPDDVAWIIPSATGGQNPREADLDPHTRVEAEMLGRRLAAAKREAWFAASRAPFESYGLVHFPILIDLDAAGRIVRIRMGDAAPAHP